MSVDSNGLQGNDDSGDRGLSLSRDGRYVAFESFASDLVSGDANFASDVFVHDLATGETARVDVDSGGTEGNHGGEAPSISQEGRYIAFDSPSDNLVGNDTNRVNDIFRYAPVKLTFNGIPSYPNPVNYTVLSANSSQTGNLALVLLSCSGTDSTILPNGHRIYLTFDECTLSGFHLLSFLSAIIGSAGIADTPIMVFPPGISPGTVVYSAAVTIDSATEEFVSVTDPIWFTTQ